MSTDPIHTLKQAFVTGMGATLVSIAIGLTFKIWLASWVAKADLALFHTVVDVISLSLILMSGFRSSMVVSYSQTRNASGIINLFRFVLIAVVLLTWGGVIPYMKHALGISVPYLQLVGIIVALGLKLYFTNLLAMYRLYDLTNRTTWLDPALNVVVFLGAYYLVGLEALSALFSALTLSSLCTALYMFLRRRQRIATLPLQPVHLDSAMVGYMKKSVIATLEAGASILMIYLAVLLTVRYFTVDELGDFQVVVRTLFTYMTLLFVFPIYRFVLPELAVKVRGGDHQAIEAIRRWVFKLAVLVSGAFFVIVWQFGQPLIGALYPETYLSAVPVLLHFSVFFIFMMLNAYQLAYIKAHGDFKTSLAIRVVGIVTLVAMFHLLRVWTDNVVAIITALGLGYLMMFVLSSIKERQLRPPTSKPPMVSVKP
ncbi:hypothetical protein [Vibrio sp. SCSIO 43169]|uniref:lipopolysaccharide biosynthesis protein n=1 Tax=Vibrio sp. SCSIO 43169 TaxID=2822801 RepID=UPI0020441497|nr:hypothetical protein [Vibrio sp. SCSIO 43169]MCM5511083.1 hypothetical protein [Vibrio sp. SCSIO 43169]